MRKIGLALVIAIMLVGVVRAQTVDDNALFEVSGIRSDVAADNVAVAKERALLHAQREAFKTLIARLVVPEQRASVATLSDEDLSLLVKNYGVSNEKMSSDRYIAEFVINFRPQMVKDFLKNGKISYVAYASAPVLILPIWQDNNTFSLWEDNVWNQTWRSLYSAKTELVPFVVPLGDASDMSLITATEAVNIDKNKILDLANKYQAKEAVIVVANVQNGKVSFSANKITAAAVASDGDVFFFTKVNDKDVLNNGAQEILQKINSHYLTKTANDESVVSSVKVRLVPRDLNEWAAINSVLKKERLVSNLVLETMSRAMIVFTMEVRGDLKNFGVILAEQGISFACENNECQISKR